MSNWREMHGQVIHDFLQFMNKSAEDFILKGGTALLSCYGLNRFSEDIDLDGRRKGIGVIVSHFCNQRHYTWRTAKDTDTVQRYFIDYGNAEKPLKIETSYRRKHIPTSETTRIDGIIVYTIDILCIMKTNAYTSRDKIRDLYDLSFICNRYWDALSPQTLALVRSAIEYKGIEQFDYIVREQRDELIDNDKLASAFLKMYERLDLLADESQKNILKKHEKNFHRKNKHEMDR